MDGGGNRISHIGDQVSSVVRGAVNRPADVGGIRLPSVAQALHIIARAPKEGTLDFVASKATGKPLCYGALSHPANEEQKFLNAFVEKVRCQFPDLLEPLASLSQSEDMPKVLAPIDEPLVMIDPSKWKETGLVPKAAYWQSGWEIATPYVAVRQSVYEKMLQVAKVLREIDPNLTIVIMDGWRDLELQRELYKAFYPNGHDPDEPLYVSPPQLDDALAAPHCSGGAIDVFLGRGQNAIDFGTPYDYMNKEANTEHFEHEGDELIRDLRRIWTNLFKQEDMVVLMSEWWHVEYGTRYWAMTTGNDPLYGNAQLSEIDYEGVSEITPVYNSRRESIVCSAQNQARSFVAGIERIVHDVADDAAGVLHRIFDPPRNQ